MDGGATSGDLCGNRGKSYRITGGQDYDEIVSGGDCEEIRDYDERIKYSVREKEKINAPFYVTHFPKKRFSKEEFKNELCLVPRNAPTRKMIKQMALSQADFRKNCYQFNTRIHGIDACSNEIGCRPETFATEFRYLRAAGNFKCLPWWYEEKEKLFPLSVHVTFHAGEDFLGICDGLRAIDEAITFLEFQRATGLGMPWRLASMPRIIITLREEMLS